MPRRNSSAQADQVVQMKKSSARTFTHAASAAIFQQMTDNPRVTVITAAMCQGNKLEQVRDAFPDRFFDTGICEGHAVALAAGQAKVGLRPIVDIYSTFLQRSYDQIFQEVALQNLPVTFMLDRAGLAGPDGPDASRCVRLRLPARVSEYGVMAPADEHDLRADARLWHCVTTGRARFAIQRRSCRTIDGERTPVEFGKSEVLSWGDDGAIVALRCTCCRRASKRRDYFATKGSTSA